MKLCLVYQFKTPIFKKKLDPKINYDFNSLVGLDLDPKLYWIAQSRIKISWRTRTASKVAI